MGPAFQPYSGGASDASAAASVCCGESNPRRCSPPPPSPPPHPPLSSLPTGPRRGPSAPRLIPGSLQRYRSALASHQRAHKSSPPFLSFVNLFPLARAHTHPPLNLLSSPRSHSAPHRPPPLFFFHTISDAAPSPSAQLCVFFSKR